MNKINTLKGIVVWAILFFLPLLAMSQDPTFGGGTGTASDPYLIGTKEHFEALVKAVQAGEKYNGKYFFQTADLNLGSTTLKPFSLEGIYIGNYYKLGHFTLEIPKDAQDVTLFAELYATILENVTISHASGENLAQLQIFRIAETARDVAFSNVNANLDFGTRTMRLDLAYARAAENIVLDNSTLTTKMELGAVSADIKVVFFGTLAGFNLLRGDLELAIVKTAAFTGLVKLNSGFADLTECATLAGKRSINITGEGIGTIDQTAYDAAFPQVYGLILYSKDLYSDVNAVAVTGTESCLGLTDAELKMDIAKAKTTVINGSTIYLPYQPGFRFIQGEYPAPRWYRAPERYRRALANVPKNSKETPFEIENVTDFIVAAEMGITLQFVKQTADIDFSTSGESIMHNGSNLVGKIFHYDGGGHKIRGVNYDAPSEAKCVKFALFQNGSISNVVLDDAKISVRMGNISGEYACLAVMPEELTNCTLNNCKLTLTNSSSTPKIISAGIVAAGLAPKGVCTGVTINTSALTLKGNDLYGVIGGAIAKIEATTPVDKQTVSGVLVNNLSLNIEGEAESGTFMLQAGGLFGLVSHADIFRCGVSGTFAASKPTSVMCLGGGIGAINAAANIAQCYAKMSLQAAKLKCIGGFVGQAYTNDYTISDCYVNIPAFETQEGESCAGFIGNTEVNPARMAIENCYITSPHFVLGAAASAHSRPFASYLPTIAAPTDLGLFLKNCYYKIDNYPAAAQPALVAQAQSDLSNPSNFNNWNFYSTWLMVDNAPVLRWEKLVTWMPEGDGSETHPFLIASLDNLRWLSENYSIWSRNFHYKQVAEIDATETKDWNTTGTTKLGFRPIGSALYPFTGTYDGNNFDIRNLYIGAHDETLGFFGVVDGGKAVLAKIKLDNLKVEAGDAAKFVGGLVGQINAHEAQITDCRVTIDAITTGISTTTVGGFAGQVNNIAMLARSSVTASNPTSTILAKAGTVGGFVGNVQSGCEVLQELYTDLSVVEDEAGTVQKMGGFIGNMEGGAKTVLQNTYSRGDVKFRTPSNKGAYIGSMEGTGKIYTSYTTGKVEDISAASPVLITNCGFGGNYTGGTLEQNYFLKKQGEQEITSPTFDDAGKCTGLEKTKMQSGIASDMLGFSPETWKFEAGKYPELFTSNATQKGQITIEKVGEDKGTIVVSIAGLEVTSGNLYRVGSVVTIRVTVNEPDKSEVKITVNDAPLTLTNGQVTYTVAEGKNAIKVTIEQKNTGAVVEDTIFADVVVAPNPFATQLHISTNELEGEYALLNTHGVILGKGVVEAHDVVIDTAVLPAGMYLLRLTTTTGASKTYRLVKN